MKATDLFVDALAAEGAEIIFGLPGEENLDLLESIAGSEIRFITTRHEQCAGFMAATYGRLTGKAGLCLATLGPGATNLVTAVAYAQLGAMPLIAITGQKPVKTSKQGQFQIVDIVNMMQPLTKLSRRIASGDRVTADLREAFRLAQQERPGAVHLELPEDVAVEKTTAQVLPRVRPRRPVADEKAIRKAVGMLRQAQRPLLLIGAGANRTRTSEALQRFVQATELRFFTTQMGKGVLDERDPRWLGTAALSSGDFVHRAIAHADLIINVGHDVVEKPPFLMQIDGDGSPGQDAAAQTEPDRGDRPPACQQTQVLHVNFTSASVDPVYFPHAEVIGDIASNLNRLTDALEPQSHWDFRFFDKVHQHLLSHIRDDEDDTQFPVRPQRLVADVRRALPSDSIVTLDNGMYKIWFARNYQAHSSNSLLLDNALASMGAGLPSAIAARLVHPDRPVLAVCGDGGYLMNAQELETAVRLQVDLTVLVLRDDEYGMIRWKQRAMGFREFGLSFDNPDFCAHAESYGAHGHRLTDTAELLPLLTRCRDEPGVHVIDIPIDYSENQRVLDNEIQQLSSEL